MLVPCPRCKEKSVVRKLYYNDYQRKKVEFCIRKGCGYRQDLPLKEAVYELSESI